jgi:hypothetical protein
MPAYSGEPAVSLADAITVARWVGRLRRVVEADSLKRSPAYFLPGMGVSGALAAQVLAAYEDGE